MELQFQDQFFPSLSLTGIYTALEGELPKRRDLIFLSPPAASLAADRVSDLE